MGQPPQLPSPTFGLRKAVILLPVNRLTTNQVNQTTNLLESHLTIQKHRKAKQQMRTVFKMSRPKQQKMKRWTQHPKKSRENQESTGRPSANDFLQQFHSEHGTQAMSLLANLHNVEGKLPINVCDMPLLSTGRGYPYRW